MMIDINKKYQTRAGRPVELLTTSARGARPVIGYIGGEEQASLWSIDGAYGYSHPGAHAHDLVEVKPNPKPKRALWLNVYPKDEVHVHESREDADRHSGNRRIACLKIEFDEGEGL